MDFTNFVVLAEDLELAGLVWSPEIGDEIIGRQEKQRVSILVDPEGLTPGELRETYIWLPTVEQMILQFEVRQAILAHAGLELDPGNIQYKTVVQYSGKELESSGENLRTSMGKVLRDLLLTEHEGELH